MGQFNSRVNSIFSREREKSFLFFSYRRTTPAAPPFPDQWQTAKENIHQPPQEHERSVSISSADDHRRRSTASSDRLSTVDNLQNIISSMQQHSANVNSRSQSRRLSSSSSSSSSSTSHPISETDRTHPTSVQQGLIYATVQPPPQQKQHSRQSSYAESIHSISSASPSKRSPAPSTSNTYQQIASVLTPQREQQQVDRIASRPPSVASSSRLSSDRFPPPPPPNIETLDLYTNATAKPHRSTPSVSSRSSAYVDVNEVETFPNSSKFNPNFLNFRQISFRLNVSIPIRTFLFQ